jgi:GWxTD domain-containing protein
MIRARSLLYSTLLATAACGGGGTSSSPGSRPEPTSAEQTLTDLFNLTQLYQRMGRLAGGNPLPFVGAFAYFAGRGDSTIALLSVSLDNRALSFQRAGRDFAARYRVEVGFQTAGALPLRYSREEAVTVGTFQETQRADETVLFQQAFLLPPGEYTASVVVRDPGGGTFSRAESPIVIPSYPAGTFTAPVVVYKAMPRPDLWTEPNALLNPRGTVAHGGDSLTVLVEGYGFTRPTKVPFTMRDAQDQVLVSSQLEFEGGKAVESRVVQLPPDAPSLGRLTVSVGQGADEKQTTALVSFSRTWVLTNYENLIDLLRFYGYEDRLSELRKSPPEQRAQLWRKFWVETDPIPTTPENEALEQYFTRVAIANDRFREEGANQGWKSDRGEVLITLGPPDHEVETPPGTDNRYVQWTYSEYRTVLIFQGQLGFSRLRLTPSSRSEFARVRALARQRTQNRE